MSAEENKALSRRVNDEIFNNRNLALADELFDADFFGHGAPGKGPESIKQAVNMMTTAFPDIQYTIEDMVAEGDKVVIYFTHHGTHQGDFMGLAATGKQFTASGVLIQRVTGGKMAEWWAVVDNLTIMQQLGAVSKSIP